jgi:hypothetical protein
MNGNETPTTGNSGNSELQVRNLHRAPAFARSDARTKAAALWRSAKAGWF